MENCIEYRRKKGIELIDLRGFFTSIEMNPFIFIV